MPQIEERTARIEGILEQMSERINDLRSEVTERIAGLSKRIDDMREEMTGRISALEKRVDGLEGKVEGLRREVGALGAHLTQQIQDNFRWTMAILIGSWVTIVGIMITLFTTMR